MSAVDVYIPTRWSAPFRHNHDDIDASSPQRRGTRAWRARQTEPTHRSATPRNQQSVGASVCFSHPPSLSLWPGITAELR